MNTHQPQPSTLARLRSCIPGHNQVTWPEALRIAELHANRLLELNNVTTGPTPVEIITTLPKISVRYVDQPVAGASFWDPRSRRWVIHVNRYDSRVRKRFTIAHEYKHIIDHGATDRLYPDSRRAVNQREAAADYFAACLLMPRRLVKQAWGRGIQRIPDLAAHFQVSEQAMKYRVDQIGLVDRDYEPVRRCVPPREASAWNRAPMPAGARS
ncbi:MAG: ImmA/IrrE family metallo-endopeptidase [Gordonia sp. (in: high G+C Gram-positive bacteria)]|uniref:ImmA/IrrE family metallo-endopeptidase n=1 Tax=Gordonia sp. (in: high G+C Gram-positive bacteria) TaxID=84139 RepID=UPI0039E3983E